MKNSYLESVRVVVDFRLIGSQLVGNLEFYRKGHQKYEEFDKVDQFRYRATLAWRITLQANIYEQYHNRLLAKEVFDGWEGDFRYFIEKRRVMDRWKDLRGFYNPSFHPYVEKLIREVEDRFANPSSKEDKGSDASHVLNPLVLKSDLLSLGP